VNVKPVGTLLLLAATLGAGCVRTYSVVPTGEYTDALQAHYVVIQGAPSGKFKLYDCRSAPDGQTWAPACAQVDLRRSP
jgi:hypothetical protein